MPGRGKSVSPPAGWNHGSAVISEYLGAESNGGGCTCSLAFLSSGSPPHAGNFPTQLLLPCWLCCLIEWVHPCNVISRTLCWSELGGHSFPELNGSCGTSGQCNNCAQCVGQHHCGADVMLSFCRSLQNWAEPMAEPLTPKSFLGIGASSSLSVLVVMSFSLCTPGTSTTALLLLGTQKDTGRTGKRCRNEGRRKQTKAQERIIIGGSWPTERGIKA